MSSKDKSVDTNCCLNCNHSFPIPFPGRSWLVCSKYGATALKEVSNYHSCEFYKNPARTTKIKLISIFKKHKFWWDTAWIIAIMILAFGYISKTAGIFGAIIINSVLLIIYFIGYWFIKPMNAKNKTEDKNDE